MIIGVDYYPEHWDAKMWEDDISLMKKAGVRLVRLAEFAWCKIEPQEGRFDFEWLDRAVDLFEKNGIDVILCTPTNCPPLWLYEKYPQAVRTSPDGGKIAIGIRGHSCPNNPDFVRLSNRVVDVMTKHYADRKSVAAWQIDNELESNTCACEVCTDRYRTCLLRKHGSLEGINAAYGSVVWSGELSSLSMIKIPTQSYSSAWLNPGMMLDYRRFCSDDTKEYVKRQARIIRKNCPDAKITTNCWFSEHMPDLHKIFDELDFVSYDNYPPLKLPQDSQQHYSHSFHLDFMRGIKSKSFCIMEQLSGAMGCWSPMSHTTYPGMIRGYSLQAIAHGADCVVHFRFRTACKGAEMHWHGLIDHSSIPGRRFREFEKLCRDVQMLEEIDGAAVKSDIALLYSYDSDAAFKLQPQTDGFDYYNQLKAYHEAFAGFGANVDIICAQSDFSGYKAVCAPALYVCPEWLKKRLVDYVKNGGCLILTCRSAVKDEDNGCIMSSLPCGLTDLTGCHVAEYDPMGYDRVSVLSSDNNEYQCSQWCDILECHEAKTLLTYAGNFYKGLAAASVNRFGAGRCYYIGTVLFKDYYRTLAEEILRQTGSQYFKDIPERVEITKRENDRYCYYFCFNNSCERAQLSFMGESLDLDSFDMRVIRIGRDKDRQITVLL